MITFPAVPAVPARPLTLLGPILFVGDSVTYGVRPGVTEAQTFRAIVGSEIGCGDVNKGVGGDNSAMMLARLPSYLSTPSSYSVCCIMSGINDALPPNNISLAQYQANLNAMIDLCWGAGVKVLLCTPNAIPGSNPTLWPFVYAMRYNVAHKRGIPLADAFQAFAETALRNCDGGASLMVDAQHPNPAGHVAISSEINWQMARANG